MLSILLVGHYLLMNLHFNSTVDSLCDSVTILYILVKLVRLTIFFKTKFDKNPHRYYFRELILYYPFRDENELFPDDPAKCEELYLKNMDEIKVVKAQVMPFLESVEEAQLIYEEMKAQEEQDVQEKMGADLDPENEQEIADLDMEDEEEHPDYYHLDPDQVEDNPTDEVGTRRVFKTIALPSKLAQVILKSH